MLWSKGPRDMWALPEGTQWQEAEPEHSQRSGSQFQHTPPRLIPPRAWPLTSACVPDTLIKRAPGSSIRLNFQSSLGLTECCKVSMSCSCMPFMQSPRLSASYHRGVQWPQRRHQHRHTTSFRFPQFVLNVLPLFQDATQGPMYI